MRRRTWPDRERRERDRPEDLVVVGDGGSHTGEDTDGDGVTDSGTGIVASTSVDDVFETWGVSGVAFTATSNPDSGTMQGHFDGVNAANSFPDDCVDEGRQDYSDVAGRIQFWTACGGDTQWITVAARAIDPSHGVIVDIALAPGDEGSLDPILESFRAVGPVPG